MPLYARTPGRRARQIAADIFVALWAAGWWIVGQVLSGLIRGVAAAADTTSSASSEATARLTDISATAARVPLVGTQLAGPFDDLAALTSALAASSGSYVGTLSTVASVTAWVTFGVPVALVVLVWLPRRIAFARNARAILNIASRPGSQDLLALRTLATASPVELEKLDGDPAAAWRSQDPTTIAELAHLALVSAGVARP